MAELSWRARARPLAPLAAIACGEAALELGRRLLEDEDAGRFRAAGGPGCLLIAGQDLPWLEGIQYLGASSEAPTLFLPTTLEPVWPLDLLETSLRRLGQNLPCAILPGFPGRPEAPFLFSFAGAGPLDRETLAGWLVREGGEKP